MAIATTDNNKSNKQKVNSNKTKHIIHEQQGLNTSGIIKLQKF